MENKIDLNPEAVQRVRELQNHLEDVESNAGRAGIFTRISRRTRQALSGVLTGGKLAALIIAGATGASLPACDSSKSYQNPPAATASAAPGPDPDDERYKVKKSALEMSDTPNFTDPTAPEWDQPQYDYTSWLATGEVEGRRVMIFRMDDGTGWKTYYVDSDASTPEECFAQGVLPKLLESPTESVSTFTIHDGELYFTEGTGNVQVGTLTFQGASGDLEVTNAEEVPPGFGASYINVIEENGVPHLYVAAGSGMGKINLITGEGFPLDDLDGTCGVPDAGANGVCVLPFQVNGDECWIAMKPTVDSPDTDIQFATTLNQGSTQNLSPHLIEVDGRTLVVFMKQIGGRFVPVYSEVLPYCGDGECNGDETSDTCPQDCPVVDPDPDQTDIDAGSTDTAEPSDDIDAGSTDTGDTQEPDETTGEDVPQADETTGEDIPQADETTGEDIPQEADETTGEDISQEDETDEPDTTPDIEPDASPDVEPDTEPDTDPDTDPDTTIPPECTDNPSHVEAEMPVTSCPIEYDGLQLEFSGEGEAVIYDPNNLDKEPFSIRIERSEHNPGGPFKVTCLQYPGYPKADCEADSPGIKVQIVEDEDGYKAEVKGYGVTTGCAASNYMFNNVGQRMIIEDGIEKTLTVIDITSYNEPDEPLIELWNGEEGWYAQIPSNGVTYRINAKSGAAIPEMPVPDITPDSSSDVSGGDVDSAETETGGGGGGGCQSCNSANEKTNPNAIPLVVMTAVLALLYRKNRQKMQETSPRITGEIIARKTREALARIFSRSR